MNTAQAACNYALLRFIPYPQTGEMVNVGVLVNCLQPCLLQFLGEEEMPPRVKAVFPDYHPKTFAALAEPIRNDVKRISDRIKGPKDCRIAFRELVRPRENILRFGEVRTILSDHPEGLAEELFRRYVRMETLQPRDLAST